VQVRVNEAHPKVGRSIRLRASEHRDGWIITLFYAQAWRKVQ
jgi:hypothetical protein